MSAIFRRVAGALLFLVICATAQTAQDIAALRAKAESGNVQAQEQLAYLYDQGKGVPQDDVQAAFWLRKAADQRDSWAETQLGKLYSEGSGVPKDEKLAIQWWRKADAQGDTDATRLLAGSGDVAAQWAVGSNFDSEGQYTQAAVWFRKAAERGDAEAQDKLGHLYSEGKGVPQDKILAAVWWRKAADQGNANAQSSLGLAYINGDGVPNDFGEAAFWLRKSAEQGDASGQARLSLLYEAGWGVPQDYAQAAAWTQKAAEQGDASAQGHLGDLYLNGQGVPQSSILAEFWYGKAASQGGTDAQNALEQLKSKLAANEAERQRRQNQIFIAVVCLAFFGAVTLTAIRLRRKLIGYGRRLFPSTSRSRQLAVLLLVGGWCSACCLIQVLSRRAMLHPVNAAVTALLWAFPGLFFGAVCMWWLSHPTLDGAPVNVARRPEPADAVIESTPEHTESVSVTQVYGYQWGKFQGWATLICGLFAILVLIGKGDILGAALGSLSAVAGYGLIRKERWGFVLYFIGAGTAAVIALLVDLLAILPLFSRSESASSVIGEAFVVSTVNGLWWIIPAIFYYPKRWKELSRRPSKAAPREAPPAIEADPQKARAEVGFFQTPK
jgi:TPR repeat protein